MSEDHLYKEESFLPGKLFSTNATKWNRKNTVHNHGLWSVSKKPCTLVLGEFSLVRSHSPPRVSSSPASGSCPSVSSSCSNVPHPACSSHSSAWPSLGSWLSPYRHSDQAPQTAWSKIKGLIWTKNTYTGFQRRKVFTSRSLSLLRNVLSSQWNSCISGGPTDFSVASRSSILLILANSPTFSCDTRSKRQRIYYRGHITDYFPHIQHCCSSSLPGLSVTLCLVPVSMKPLLLKRIMSSDWSTGSVCCDWSATSIVFGKCPAPYHNCQFQHYQSR